MITRSAPRVARWCTSARTTLGRLGRWTPPSYLHKGSSVASLARLLQPPRAPPGLRRGGRSTGCAPKLTSRRCSTFSRPANQPSEHTACGWGRPVCELATRATDSGTVRASEIDQELALRRLHEKLFPTAPLSLGRFGSLSVTGTSVSHFAGNMAHRTWRDSPPENHSGRSPDWNHSRLGPSIEGVSPCESS
jgi:hypothetical protein